MVSGFTTPGHDKVPSRDPKRTLRRLARRVGRVLWNDKVAAAHTVFYLVAAALFLPIVAGLFLFLDDTADNVEKPTAGLRSRAVQGLAQITQSSGAARTDSVASSSYWENLVEKNGFQLREMGIKDENSTGLSFPKIDNLQRGGLIQRPDAYINYPEFKDHLSLGRNYDFHVRLYPVVQDTVGDTYGTGPIRGTHLAYVANLTDHHVTLGSGEWTNPSTNASREIQALIDIDLNASPATQATGFDAKSYQPITYQANSQSGYLNLGPVKRGDVIGDTSIGYREGLLDPAKPYWQWFVEDHLFKSDGTNRYDVVVFGSDVHLARWDDPIAKAAFQTYLVQGGSIIFLGQKNAAPDFVTDCVSADCLLTPQGSGQPVSTPDVTNQMLTVPNELAWKNYQGGYGDTAFWNVCDTERNGWIPIAIQTMQPTCTETWFGATSSDRYGPTGGTLIVNGWDIPSSETRKFLANTISFGVMRGAYLDYGPEIPVRDPVESAERLLTTQIPSGEYLDVKLVFYLWRGDCTADQNVLRGDLC